MIGFLNPYWFLGFFALIIPIIIHFWNKKPAKNIEIGSIFLLGTAKKVIFKRGLLIQPWLLLLRCLLVSVFVLLFVRPYINKVATSENPEKWILIQSPVNVLYRDNRHIIDSLMKKGYTAHSLSSGFAKINLDKVTAPDSLRANLADHKVTQFWSLLGKLDTMRHHPVEVHLYSNNQLSFFSGLRPSISFKLHWHITKPTDSSYSQLRSAYETFSGETRRTKVITSPKATYFKLDESVSNSPAQTILKASELPVSITLGVRSKSAVKLTGDVDSLSYHITIYYDADKISDAAYSAAAFRAVRAFTKRKLIISLVELDPGKQINQPDELPATGILWLSYGSLPARFSLAKTLTNGNLRFLLKYERSEELVLKEEKFRQNSNQITDTTTYTNQLSYPLLTGNIELSKLYISKNSAEPCWRDNAGNTVLSRDTILQHNSKNQQKGQFKGAIHPAFSIYHFYSRFNPHWNSLVSSAEFPQFLIQLLANAYPQDNFMDRRVVSMHQLLPELSAIPEDTYNQVLSTYKFDLFPFLFVFLTLLLIAERWLSYV